MVRLDESLRTVDVILPDTDEHAQFLIDGPTGRVVGAFLQHQYVPRQAFGGKLFIALERWKLLHLKGVRD